MTRRRVLFYVQHLLGIGHLRRAATLTRAFEEAGLSVTLVSGGPAVPGLDVGGARLVQLPAVRAADKSFRVLMDDDGRVIDEPFRARRRALLLDTFAETRPEVIVTELFPFGRRQLSFELMPLLEAARQAAPRPLMVCSVRDILVESPKPERQDEMLARIESFYELVLVHGDPAFVPFERTFPGAARIAGRIRYTGYVVEAPPTHAGTAGAGEVIVSAGGGAVSEALFRAAFATRAMTRLGDAPWRVLVGHALPEPAFAALRTDAPVGFVVERARSDFLALLANCRLSISQGGYNTVMEVLATGARAVIVPYAGGLETEQTLRARALAPGSHIQVLEESDLAPEAIARAVDAALDAPPPGPPPFDTNGAAASARLLMEALSR